MDVNAGDIVKRRVPPGRSINEPWWSMTASNLFYDGFYIVLEVIITSLIDKDGNSNQVSVCKIMDENGQLNWISSKKLIKVF